MNEILNIIYGLLAADRKRDHCMLNMSDYFNKIEWIMREKKIIELDI